MAEDKKISDAAQLLLKGGKMLGFHCNECGTPLFQMESNIFCPHCQKKYRVVEKDGKKTVEPVKDAIHHTPVHERKISAERHVNREILVKKLEALFDKIAAEALESDSIHDVRELVKIMREISEILKELER